MPKVIIHPGAEPAREFELKTGINSVGRGDANDLQIQDSSVSTHHAEIIVDENGVRVKDLGSTNGTFINDLQVNEEFLQPGQPFRLGTVALIFEDDLPVAVAAPAAPASIPTPGVAPNPARVRVTVTAPQTAQAPAGKTACKFHPKSAGEWLCPKCNELFCSVCVNLRHAGGGTTALCRKCGGNCTPVKVNFVAAKEKEVKVYSDPQILVRCFGFGLAAALLSAGIWTGLSWLFGVDILFLFLPMVAVICGFAVKLASQDRPGPVFSAIATGYFIVGSVLGKMGMIAVTHLTLYTGTVMLTGVVGLILGTYAAWKIGGGE